MIEFAHVEAETFGAAFTAAQVANPQIAESCSDFDADGDIVFFLSTDDASGYAIRDFSELVYVFSTVRGRGDEIVSSAVANGAARLDCFDGYLPTLYRRHGFVTYDREANWTPGGPDVVWMAIPTNVTRARCADHFTRYSRDLGPDAGYGCPEGCEIADADIYLEWNERHHTDSLGYLSIRTFPLA